MPPMQQADEPQIRVSSNGRRTGKVKLLTRRSLDRRSRAAKLFDRIFEGIASDLGGKKNLSTVETALAEAFAGAAVRMHDMNAHLLLGQDVNLTEHAMAISSLVRIASRIGTRRRARNVTPNLAEYIRDIEGEAAE